MSGSGDAAVFCPTFGDGMRLYSLYCFNAHILVLNIYVPFNMRVPFLESVLSIEMHCVNQFKKVSPMPCGCAVISQLYRRCLVYVLKTYYIEFAMDGTYSKIGVDCADYAASGLPRAVADSETQLPWQPPGYR